jgi:glycerophosphoryl diester phosphodiesterase
LACDLPGSNVLVTAHRGSSGIAPENTLAALQQAIVDGADGAEVDVQVTADGELVLFHDAGLRRIAGDDRRLCGLTYPEVCQLDAGRWFGPQFVGEPIPRLADAVDLVRGRLWLNLELKAYGGQALAPLVVAQLRRLAFTDCILTSFDRELLWQVHQLAPPLKLGLICAEPPGELADWLALYSLGAAIATPQLTAQIQAAGKAVHIWTVNQPSAMRGFIRQGVDSLITDHPRRLRQILAATAS